MGVPLAFLNALLPKVQHASRKPYFSHGETTQLIQGHTASRRVTGASRKQIATRILQILESRKSRVMWPTEEAVLSSHMISNDMFEFAHLFHRYKWYEDMHAADSDSIA